MTLPYLPDDCIYYILKYLQNYRSTLFNCLLVNRFWCKATVPLLYADPFKGFNLIDKHHASIILTLILCFNETEILQLKNQLKLIKIKNRIINKINEKVNNECKLLFEYPKYLKNFDCPTLGSMIQLWFETSLLKVKIFIPMLCQSILRQCNNIEQLDISLHISDVIQTFPSNLTTLNSLRLCLNVTDDNENLQEFLSNIENNCLNLRKLEIFPISRTYPTNATIKEKLCTIVQKQNNLKAVKFSYCQGLSNSIFLSLEFQKSSLVYIDFACINFNNISFKIFISLCNLKYLRFDSCKEVSLDQCEMLCFASFKLKFLMFNNNYWNENITPLIIKYLGSSLRELKLFEPIKILKIENISKYCSNLITLEIMIYLKADSLAIPYFNKLKMRVLNIYHYYTLDNKVLINLANNLHINVKEVSIHFANITHSFLPLEEFLENCHGCLELINLNYSIQLKFLKLILNYIKRSNGNLKVMGVSKLEEPLEENESKLLNQIKANGIKIVDFNSIYEFNYNRYNNF